MNNETEAPERIYMSPEDAALFANKYGHPDVVQPAVGDVYVSYVMFTEPNVLDDTSISCEVGEIGNQIHNIACSLHDDEELQDRLGSLASRAWRAASQICADLSDPQAARIAELEAKLRKAVGALGDISDGEPEWPDDPQKELDWCRNRATTALAELKGTDRWA